MTTIVFGVDGNPANNWIDASYVGEVISYGTLIYLVSTERAPYTSLTALPAPGRSASHLKAFDGGVELTRAADYTTLDELLNEAPEPGHVRWYPSGPTYIRLGSVPVFDLRVISFGYRLDSPSLHSTLTLGPEAGLTGTYHGRLVVDSRFVNDASETYLDVFNEQASWQLAFFGMNRLDEFEVHFIKDPTGDPVYTFTEDNVLAIKAARPEGMLTPVYQLTANIGETWPSTMATGAPKISQDEMTRAPFFSTWKYEDSDTLLKHKLAQAVTVETKSRAFRYAWQFGLWRDRYMALFGVERDQVTVEVSVDSNTLTLDLNDVVRVQEPRLFPDGKLFRVIVSRLDLSNMKAEFVLWG